MPDALKDTKSRSSLPQNLPMPKYGYQKPSTGSASVKYDAQKETAPKDERSAQPLPSLQNFSF